MAVSLSNLLKLHILLVTERFHRVALSASTGTALASSRFSMPSGKSTANPSSIAFAPLHQPA